MAGKSTEPLPSRVMTTQQACHRLDISRQMLSKVAEAGYVKPIAENQWDEDETTQGYIRFLRAGRSARSESTKAVNDARTKAIELTTAARLGELVKRVDAIAVCDDIVGFTRGEMAGVSRRSSRDIDVRKSVDKEILAALTRVADRLKDKSEGLGKPRFND